MLTNVVITLFNRYPDKEQKKMVYLPHRIDRAWYHVSRKTTPSQGGLISSDEHMLRIPFDQCADWKPADQFATGQKGTCWTVQNGDLFIQGEWCGGEVMGIDDLKKQYNGVVGMVKSHSENFIGSSPHIRISGGV